MKWLLLLLLLLPAQAEAAFSVVAHTSKATLGTGVTTDPIETGGVSLIKVAVACADGETCTLSDNKGNTFTAETPSAQGTVSLHSYHVQSPIVGSGHTFTVTCDTGPCYPGIAVLALGGASASAFDDENQNGVTGSSSTTTGAVTPAEDNEIFVTGLAMDGFASASIDGSFIISDQTAFNAGINYGIAMAYKIQTSGGAENPTWTFSGAGDAAANLTTFKAAAASTAVRHRPIIFQ